MERYDYRYFEMTNGSLYYYPHGKWIPFQRFRVSDENIVDLVKFRERCTGIFFSSILLLNLIWDIFPKINALYVGVAVILELVIFIYLVHIYASRHKI